MAKQRYINTKFWSDNFIVGLEHVERYLFLYFLTNEHTNICGVYELPLRTLLNESALKEKQLNESLEIIKTRILYEDGWVYIKNFAKHQKANDSIAKGVERALQDLPPHVLAKFRQLQAASPQSVSSEIQPPPSLGTECHLSKSESEYKSESELESPGGQPTPKWDAKDFFGNQKRQDEEIHYLVEHGMTEEVARREVKKFTQYWTEKNSSGKKQRWELEKTYELNLRLEKWMGNIDTFSPQGKSKGSNGTVKLHDGSEAKWWGGKWVDASNPNVVIDVHYYPELTKH